MTSARRKRTVTRRPQTPPSPGVPAAPWLNRHASLLWIALATLLTISPLLVRGTSCGHDLSFHLLNWMEVSTQWHHGILRPWWAFHAAWNAGEPRFVFYPPLSWTLGALLGLLLPWTATPIAFTAIALFLSGLTMRTLLRRFVAPTLATAGACLYLANPYMLFVSTERTAYAELLAAAWMPLLLLALLRFRLRPFALATVVALLWLTNAPAAVVGCYSLLLIGTVRVIVSARTSGSREALRQAAALTTATVLGLSGAAFYLVPAIVQRRSVQISMAVLPGMRPTDSFLFQHTADPLHDAVLRSASWIAVGTLTIAFLSIAVLLTRRPRHHAYPSMHAAAASLRHRHTTEYTFALTALALLTALIALLLTPASTALWHHAPELAFLQFPWRFLSIEAAVATFLLCLALNTCLPALSRRTLTVAAACLLGAVAAWAANTAYRQPCDDEDAPSAQRTRYVNSSGTEPTDEYTPTSADNDALHPGLPPAWLTTTTDGPPDTTANLMQQLDGNPAHLHFSVPAAPAGRTLAVRLRQFPGWAVTLDGIPYTTPSERNDGLLSIPLPGNAPHEVDIRYRWTDDELAGAFLSLAAVLTALVLQWFAERAERHKLPASAPGPREPLQSTQRIA